MITMDETAFKRIVKEALRELIAENAQQEEMPVGATEAARIMRVSLDTLYGMVDSGQINCFTRGKRMFFHKKDLLDHVQKGRARTRTLNIG